MATRRMRKRVDCTLDSGLTRMCRQVRQRLARFVRSSVGVGYMSLGGGEGVSLARGERSRSGLRGKWDAYERNRVCLFRSVRWD